MRSAVALIISGGYAACLYLANHYPLFYDLSILFTGVILGIVVIDSLRNLAPEDKDRDPTPGLTRVFQESALQPGPVKMQQLNRLKVMLDKKLRSINPPVPITGKEAKAYVEGLKPDVLNLYDDVLWTVINEGEHYAFRNPNQPEHTIVMRKDFAEKALILGFLP